LSGGGFERWGTSNLLKKEDGKNLKAGKSALEVKGIAEIHEEFMSLRWN